MAVGSTSRHRRDRRERVGASVAAAQHDHSPSSRGRALEVLPVLATGRTVVHHLVWARGVAAAAVLDARARALVMHVVLEVLELVERARRFAAPTPRAVPAAAPVVRAEA